jgi:hypothetical protein
VKPNSLLSPGIADDTVTPVPVWIFIDGTVISGDMHTKAVPVYVSIGNISLEMARKDGTRVLLAYLPQLANCGFTDKQRASEWFRNRSALLMQQVILLVRHS